MNLELPEVQGRFNKDRGARDQIAKIRWIIKRAREFQKNIYFCFIDYTKALDCVDHNKLWKILQELRIPAYLTCWQNNAQNSASEASAVRELRTLCWI